MAAANPSTEKREEEVGIYNDDGMTVLPKGIRDKLGGVKKGDTLIWRHEDDGTIKLDKNEGSE